MISRNLVFLGIIIAILSMKCFVNSQIKVIENQKEKENILLTQDFGWSLHTVDAVHYTGISGNTIGEIFDCLSSSERSRYNFVLAFCFYVNDLR